MAGGHGSLERDRVFVLVAGRSGSGKSTALNNMFGLELPVGLVSRPVSAIFEQIRVKMNEVDLVIMDTRGLKDLSEDRMSIARDLAEVIKAEDYILLYCLSAVTGCGLSEVDRTIIQNLQATLGREVWLKCVLLLTFSDRVRHSYFPSASQKDGYKVYIKTIADDFQSIIEDCGEDMPSVKTVFEIDSKDNRMVGNNIMAYPVGKYAGEEESPFLLPGVPVSGDWTDPVFIAMARKMDQHKRKALVGLKYGSAVATQAVSIALGGGLENRAGNVEEDAAGSIAGLSIGLSVSDIIAAIRYCKIANYK